MPKTKYREPEIHKPSTREILYSLETEYQWLELLDHKPYSVLFDVIKKEALKDENDYSPSPSIKQIAETVYQKSATVTKWLNQIYSDLWELNELKPHLFKSEGNKYFLHFQDSNTKQGAFFTLWTTTYFNKNDTFHWSFLNGMLGTYYFYISDISHERSQGEFVTTIYLKTGLPNSYREHLLSKALFLDMIDFSDIINLRGYDLDEILKSRIEKDRPYTPDSNPKGFSRR